MQILPSTSSSFALWSSFDTSDSSEQFHDVLQEVLEEDEDENNEPLVEGPYNRHSTDGVFYTLDEVCFSKQELQDLRDALLKAGAPQQSLTRFDQLVDLPAGATLAQIMSSLIGSKGSSQLDDGDIDHLTTLLKKIDSSGSLEEDFFMHLDAGKAEDALNAIYAALAKQDAGSSLDIKRDELLALGKALGCNDSNMQAIASAFKNRDSLNIYTGQFAGLMGATSEQLGAAKAEREKLDAALDQTLRPILRKARERMEAAEKASALQSRQVEQSRIMIDKTVQENSRLTMDDILADQNEQAMLAQLQGKEDALSDHNRQNTDFFQNQGQDQQNARSRQWNELFSKIESKVENQQISKPNSGNSVLYSILQDGQGLTGTTTPGSRTNTPISRHVAQQVEQGMLSSLKGGGSRLDLQLHPMELGAITITLTARNGEVSARLIADKTETAEMLTQQMESIRINLEQQGIKVDKIEVQLQNQSREDQTAWQDLEQHNAWQEQESRREEFARLRNLATMRNRDRNSGVHPLEQSVHDMANTARYATQTLHVVA